MHLPSRLKTLLGRSDLCESGNIWACLDLGKRKMESGWRGSGGVRQYEECMGQVWWRDDMVGDGVARV